MTRLEDPKMIEATVGVRRHPTKHLARAVSSEQRVYLLHSAACVATTTELRTCPYSRALDFGIRLDVWEHDQDRAVMVAVHPDHHDLVPGDPSAFVPWPDDGPEPIALHSDDELRRMVAAVRSGDQATLDAMVAEANAAAANGDTRG